MNAPVRLGLLLLMGSGLSACGSVQFMPDPPADKHAIAAQFLPAAPVSSSNDALLPETHASSDEIESWAQKGRALLAQDQPKQALVAFGKVLSHDPDHAKALAGVVDVHLDQNRLLEADSVLDRLESVRPGSPPVRFRRARWHVMQGQYYAAQTLLEPYWEAHVQSVIRIEDLRFFSLMGAVYDGQGRHDQAERVYRAGLKVENNDASLRNNLAYCLMLQGRYVYAAAFLEDLERNAMLEPRYAENLAMAWVLADRVDRAREVLQRQKQGRIEINRSLNYYRWLYELPRQQRNAVMRGG